MLLNAVILTTDEGSTIAIENKIAKIIEEAVAKMDTYNNQYVIHIQIMNVTDRAG